MKPNRVGLVCLAGLLLLSGCSKPGEPVAAAPKPPVVVTLAAGTPVSVVLLEALESGKTEEGHRFPVAVIADVKDRQGHVLIPAGAVGEGEVVWSRRGTTMGAVSNEPARLAVTLSHVYAASLERVDIRQEGDRYEFKRESMKSALPKLASEVNMSSEQIVVLQRFEELGLRGMTAEDWQKLHQPPATALDKVFDGSVKRIGLRDLTASLEVSSLAGTLFDRVGRMLKARQVVAPVGTIVEANVVSQVQITLPDRPEE